MKKEHSRSNKELLETKYVVAESSESLEIKINEYPRKQGKKIKLEIRRKKKKHDSEMTSPRNPASAGSSRKRSRNWKQEETNSEPVLGSFLQLVAVDF